MGGMALLGFGGGLAGGVLFVATQRHSQTEIAPVVRDTVIARKFVLVDSDGEKRAELSTESKGFNNVTYLRLMDDSGKPELNLEVDGWSAQVAAMGNKGEVGATLFTNIQRSAIVLNGKAGESRAVLMGDEFDGIAQLSLSDRAGNDQVFLVGAPHEASLSLSDASRKQRAWLGDLSGDVSLTLSDRAGNERATLGSTDLKIPRTGSTEHRAESSLVLFDEKGKMLYAAP